MMCFERGRNVRLSMTTDYGIRMILCLAAEKRMMNSREISRAMDIPRDYTVQVGGKLKRAGIVRTHAGHLGGYTLARDVREITMFDVVGALEGTMRIDGNYKEDCVDDSWARDACPVRYSYEAVQEGIDQYLRGIKVKDLLIPGPADAAGPAGEEGRPGGANEPC